MAFLRLNVGSRMNFKDLLSMSSSIIMLLTLNAHLKKLFGFILIDLMVIITLTCLLAIIEIISYKPEFIKNFFLFAVVSNLYKGAG